MPGHSELRYTREYNIGIEVGAQNKDNFDSSNEMSRSPGRCPAELSVNSQDHEKK